MKLSLIHIFAKKAGADFLSTGHYARLERRNGTTYLKKGLDEGKDQSYFLCMLSQSQIERAMFPIGELQKACLLYTSIWYLIGGMLLCLITVLFGFLMGGTGVFIGLVFISIYLAAVLKYILQKAAAVSNISVGVRRIKAVSYTHLDVYKRQP